MGNSAKKTPVTTRVMERPPAIETAGLTKTYGARTVVAGLTIRVPSGQVVGFVGPNGAGKTTTIRMLLGLVRPTAGEARVLGSPLSAASRFLPHVGALIEAPAFYPNLSGATNLRIQARMGGFDESRVPALLDQVGLRDAAKQSYKRYSLGMKQRLGLASALLPDPTLLVLDEPTNGLDPAGILEVRRLLRHLADQGKTVFVSSHLLAEVQRMCDYLIVLDKGRLVFQGTTKQLLSRGTTLTLSPEDLKQAARLAALCRAAGHDVQVNQGAVVIQGAKPADAAVLNKAAFEAGIVLRELHAATSDLEQTFLSMTGDGES